MPSEAYRTTWATYQAAWENVSPEERQTLLNSSVADNCVYTDPLSQTHNRAELIAYIAVFRQSMPDPTFKNYKFLDHHAQSYAEWTLYNNSVEVQQGASYARYGDDGRITNVTGFFETPPDAS